MDSLQPTMLSSELSHSSEGDELQDEPRDASHNLPYPTGVFQVAEKMEKRKCALCPKSLDCGILYFAQSVNVVAHENCLLYSSALVECEDQGEPNSDNDRNFDVRSVQREIFRGRKLKCSFCGEKGATVGCDVSACHKSYHYFCAKNDQAVLQCDSSRGTYKILCPNHAPGGTQSESAECSYNFQPHTSQRTKPGRHGVKKRGRKSLFFTGTREKQLAATGNRCSKQLKEENGRHTGTSVKADFLKKCKKAGLLETLFEDILDKLHLMQKRLMDETASDSDYEEIWSAVFDYTLFEDTFANFEAALDHKIRQSKERQQQLKEEIDLLQDIQHTLSSIQGNSSRST